MPADSLLSIAGMHSSAHAACDCQFPTNTARKVPASLPRDRTSPAELKLSPVPPQSTIQECSRPCAGSNNASRQSMSSPRGGPREQTGASTDDQKARISQQAREGGLFLPLPIHRGPVQLPSIPSPKHRPFAWRDAENGANHRNARPTHRSLSQPETWKGYGSAAV